MDKPTRESIEAGQPAREDLQPSKMADAAGRVQADAEARAVRERVEAWDAAISRAIEDVAVPAGLTERILNRLQTGRPKSELLARAAAQVSEATVSVEADVLPTRAVWSRRHWAGAAVAVAAVGLLVAVGIRFWRQPADADFDVLAEQWQAKLGNKWLLMADAPRDFAVAREVRVPPVRWQWIGDFATARVAAYELVQGNAGKAMLYVARMARNDLPAAPPPRPQRDTGGRAVAWWQSGECVFVLVLENVDDYRKFVRPSTTPLA